MLHSCVTLRQNCIIPSFSLILVLNKGIVDMKRKILGLTCLIALVTVSVVALVRNNNQPQTSDKLAVSASFYPLAEFTRNVGGNHVHVTTMTPPGAEPHDFEPAPRDLAAASNARVFIYNGGQFEPWTDKFVSDYRNIAIKASAGIHLHESAEHEDDHASEEHDHGTADPHFWLDPVLAQTMVRSIRDGLIKADPANSADYTANAQNYIAKLNELDKAYQQGLADCAVNTVIASHGALGYLAERYSFTAESITGISPDQEPSSQKLAELSSLAREKNIRYIFFEHLVSPRLADTIATEVGAQTLVFDPLEGLTKEDQNNGKNYLSIQYDNLKNLQTARACR